ncbi:MAG: dipeptidase [Armatimonadetes bacterium]|nr:dipeptidase [Armatimonadota bacterium]
MPGIQKADPYLVQAKLLHAQYPLIDGHNDLPWGMRNREGGFDEFDIRLRQDTGQTDIPRLREGGLGGQFWSVYVPTSLPGGEAVEATMQQIEIVYDMADRYSDVFEMAYTADDVMRIFNDGKIASMIGVEGGHCINSSLQALRAFYRQGARYMTVTHSSNTPWADSATDEPQNDGLNAFGEQVIREMNRLGMLVDLSHVSADTMRDVFRVTRAPVIYSHSGAGGVTPHPRNVPDDILPLVKVNGGVIMVIILASYTSPAIYAHSQARDKVEETAIARYGEGDERVAQTVERWLSINERPIATLSQVADHIDHIKNMIGVDHIGIGGDYDGGGGVEGLEDVSTYPKLTAELLRRGYTDEEIGKILGLNVIRVMREAERVSRVMKREG